MAKDQFIHFVGIGGIGVSALAKYYLHRGVAVSGSDLKSSEITEELKNLGTEVYIGPHQRSNLPQDAKMVVYTAAAPKDNPELLEAKRRKIKTRSYAEAVGELTKKYKTIAVSGAHGKSTTTALTALILEEGYFDPTVIIGTKVKEFGGSNFRKGSGAYLVLEADEWNKSFLNYSPHIAVVTNIDTEHLDTYKNVGAVEKTFREFLKKVPRQGAIVANADDPRLKQLAPKLKKRVVWYSLKDREASAVRRVLKVPGEHNVSNALAALRVGQILGVCQADILRALSRFSGTWRRFDFQGIRNGAYIFSDYGHHPQEIQATLTAARGHFPFRRIWCVYQPHQYQRLAYLWNDFTRAFDRADRICLLPVYNVAGRETKKAKVQVSSLRLSHELLRRGKNIRHLATFDEAKQHILAESRPGDVILVMGAGDIHALSKSLV